MKNTALLRGLWDRVDKAVALSGMSKAEIARRGNFNRKALYRLDGVGMHSRVLAALCAVTKVSADWILFGGDMK